METRGKIPILSLVLILFLLIFPTGCATTNFDELSKTAKGSIAGAATGAIAGGLATGDARGVIVGALVGGFIGNRIGAYLDEQDQEQLKQLQLQSLKSGKPQSFVTRKTGDKVIIETDAAQRELVETFEVAGDIAEYGLIPADEVSISAYVNTPVYAEANARKKPRYVLKQGNGLYVPVHVAGKKGWGAVVEKGMIGGGQVVGYVPLSYLNPKTAKPYSPPASNKAAKKKPEIKTAKKQDAAPAPQPATGDAVLASETPKPETQPEEAAPVAPPAAGDDGIVLVSEAPKSTEPVRKADLNLRCKTTRIKVKDVFEEQKFCEKPPPKWIMI
ncbi:MAG: hypothetical protein LBU46_01330 [Candidatus Accumulibacter sp.]|jgi:hypothetical protein|nr:hypothetical protein [Accumulibacter sp.]